MKQDTKDLLRDVLKEAKDDNVSAVLLNLIDYDKEPGKLSYDDLFGNKVVLTEDAKRKDKTIRDERIKWMTFCNFRSVPDSGEIKRYGVKFTIDNKPVSVFLVGSNGVGKTTLYSALEHHYISASSLSKDMNLDEEKILTYGLGAIEGQQPTSLMIQTIGGENEEYLHSHEGLCSPASFCSEYDLKQLGEHGDNLTNYILEQLGYDELLPLILALQAIVTQKNKEVKESLDSHESEMSVEDLDSIIKVVLQYGNGKKVKDLLAKAKEHKSMFNMDYADYNVGKIPKRFVNHWNRLQSLSATPKIEDPIKALGKEATSIQKNAERANELTGKLMKMYRITEESLNTCLGRGMDGVLWEMEKLYRDRISLADKRARVILPEVEVSQIQKEIAYIERTIDLLVEKQKEIIKDFKENRFPMIKEILKTFSSQDGELEIEETIVEGKSVLKIVIKDPISGMETMMPTPQEYYNSFRYKLYAVSFKIALALMEMKRKCIRVPLVIDDVFNASDFENNIRLEYFVHNIYKAYDKMNMEIPLQLILLTHDEMVQMAFRKGANVVEEDSDVVRQPREYICGRLFNHRYAKQMSKEMGEDEKKMFYNLYLEN